MQTRTTSQQTSSRMAEGERQKRTARLYLSLITGITLTVVVLWALGAAWTTKSAHAAGIVSTCNEASLLSALSGGGVITFTCSGTITFTTAPTTGIVIASDTTVDGSGQTVILDGENARRIFNVDAGIKLTLKNVTVQRGFAIGDGGAIYSLGPLVLNNARILSSTATGGNKRGGGVYAGSTLTAQDGEFRGNVADNGGGLYTNDVAQLNNTNFISNTTQSNGDGGGMFAQNALMLTGGEFRQNAAVAGGGLVASGPSLASMNGTKFISNTATSSGGGALVGGTLTLFGSEFRGNTSNEGGGLFMNAPAFISGTLFISNTAIGFGGGVRASYTVTVMSSEFSRNTSGSGGGLSAASQTLISHTKFFTNTATSNGGGVFANSPMTITGGEFRNNTAGSGGGLINNGGLGATAATLVDGTLFNNNFSFSEGGGIEVNGPLTVLNARFIRNFASNNAAALLHTSLSNGRIVNSLFADNRPPSSGAVIRFDSAGTVEVLHNTIAAPDPLSGRGIEIGSGTVGITNTIVASYTTGLIQTGGAAYENYNLLFNLTMTRTGTFVGGSGANDVVGGAPNFVNPANDDYHLVTGSAAINAGAITNVTTDIDGEARPLGSAFDIGYDEFSQRVYLPLIVR